MLYLNRRVGETIVINGNIEITTIEIRGKTVKFGIKSPDGTSIYRMEMVEKIRKTNIESQAEANLVKKFFGG